MTREEEILNYANSFKGKGMENEELKEIIRLAIIDGAMWADKHPTAFIEKACSWLKNNLQGVVGGSIYIEDFRNYMEGE